MCATIIGDEFSIFVDENTFGDIIYNGNVIDTIMNSYPYYPPKTEEEIQDALDWWLERNEDYLDDYRNNY